jgi:hypothetical protein
VSTDADRSMRTRLDQMFAELQQERSAHEHTKAELAEARDLIAAWQDASGLCCPSEERGGDPGGVKPHHLARDLERRDAELARVQADLADTRAQLAKVRHYLDEMIRVHDEVEKDRDRVQAEAEALRSASTKAEMWRHHKDCEPISAVGCECGLWHMRRYSQTSPAALVSRLTLLEAVAKTAREFRQYTIEGKKLNAHGRIACIDTAPEALDDALAALDAKDGK